MGTSGFAGVFIRRRTMPPEYRAFLLSYNSGYPKRQNFSLLSGGKACSAEYLYGHENLAKWLETQPG
jgi:hypothetical protein